MNIVLLHCHFQRGGVTQVVQNHVRALGRHDEVDKILLIGSGRADGLAADVRAAATLVRIDALDYDERNHVPRTEVPRTNTLGSDDLGSDDRGSGDCGAGDCGSGDCGAEERPSGDPQITTTRASALFDAIRQALTHHQCDPGSSILHWHNHSLGKNASIPAVIRFLAAAGWRQLLQIHDFAEDNRPTNYRNLITSIAAPDRIAVDQYLYPLAAQIHYATLTRADQSAIERVGIPQRQSHWLPNCITAPQDRIPTRQAALAKVRSVFGLPGDARWFLYPVRGIRRKNLGEFLLLSRWLEPQDYAAITLRPTTPIEQRSYDRWRQVAVDVAPRALFGAGDHDALTFSDNLAAAESVISTSVAEGFGMTYLEPWLSGREVIARRLPTVADDFTAAGVRIEKLYDQIPIPGTAEWVARCRAEYEAEFAIAWDPIPLPFRPPMDDRDSDPTSIDFALLSPARQIEVLSRLARDRGFEAACQQRSPKLIQDLHGAPDPQTINHNQSVIGTAYSADQTGDELLKIYRELNRVSTDGPIDGPRHAGTGVIAINAIRPFYPCRTEVI